MKSAGYIIGAAFPSFIGSFAWFNWNHFYDDGFYNTLANLVVWAGALTMITVVGIMCSIAGNVAQIVIRKTLNKWHGSRTV